MEYRPIHGTGLRVSKVCLGAMTFGGQTSEQEGIDIIHYALDKGINFIDTSDNYTEGRSEIITGKGIKGRREEVVLATKVLGHTAPGPNGQGLGRKHIIAAVEKSLLQLGTDYIDVYYMHGPDYQTPFEESLEAMNSLVRAGKIRYYGLSNFAAWQLMDALWICDKRNYVAPCVTESVYNLLTRGIETELVPCCKQKNIGLAIYNPIAAGLLTGKHSKDKPVDDSRFTEQGYYDRYFNADNFAAMEKLSEIAAEAGITLLELALRWCVSYDYVSSVILGASRIDHLKQNLELIEKGPLSKETLAKCDDVWNGLKGSRFLYHRLSGFQGPPPKKR